MCVDGVRGVNGDKIVGEFIDADVNVPWLRSKEDASIIVGD